MKRFILASVIGLMSVGSVNAAGFDCAKAGTVIEKTICKVPELDKLDTELNELYKANLTDELKASQRQWVREVRNQQKSINSLTDAYKARITEISTVNSEEILPLEEPQAAKVYNTKQKDFIKFLAKYSERGFVFDGIHYSTKKYDEAPTSRLDLCSRIAATEALDVTKRHAVKVNMVDEYYEAEERLKTASYNFMLRKFRHGGPNVDATCDLLNASAM